MDGERQSHSPDVCAKAGKHRADVAALHVFDPDSSESNLDAVLNYAPFR